ncbi:MAG: S-methyl-5-thioribose-1-phosphate isomerase [Tepidisphaeraceae bacterium]
MLRPITWTGRAVRLLDQTRLPRETTFVEITDEKQMHDAIRRLVVRGAPAIGNAAAFGAYLGVRSFTDDDAPRFLARLGAVCDYLATSRPTAVNLFWALDRMKATARSNAGAHRASSSPGHVVRDIQEALLNECERMLMEDEKKCRAIGEHGLKLLEETRRHAVAERSAAAEASPFELLTHCNAGLLAGTGALSPIYVGLERGMKFHVYADETRPLLQGSRLTAFELHESGVPVTVICDNMAATVLGQKKIDAVIVGADRIAANGDTANKIGTLGVAIAARHFGVPFYVAAPISTIDFNAQSGADIPIEERAAEEVNRLNGVPTAPDGVRVYNPAFDVTPADLITAIITENGVAEPPLAQSLRDLATG